MNTVLRATDSAEFLGLVPSLAGFTPRRSIVLLPFQRSRAHGAMRIDLPRDGVDLDEYVDTAIGLVSQVRGTDAVAVVVYTDEAPQHTPDGIVLPSSIVVDELLGLSEDLGMHIVDALCVTPEGWASYLHDEPTLHPIADIPAPVSIPGLADVAGGFKLAVTTGRRVPVAPELPTIAEAGVPGFDVSSWFAFFAPEKTPKDVIAKINADTVEALKNPTVKAKLEELGCEIVGSTPQALAAHLKSEMDKWGPVIKEAKIRVEN